MVAINHTSYVDWYPSALAAYQVRRRLRFMIKSEMQNVKIVNFLIKHSGTIPVDRDAGGGAYAVAVERLRAGELVAVYPEATISRSFELKEFKSGAARMARDADGADHPDDRVGCTANVDQGPPAEHGPQEDTDHRCTSAPMSNPQRRSMRPAPRCGIAMNKLLHKVQEDYPHPEGAYWVPHRLGGSAPTIEEAKALEEAELAERARKRAEQQTKSRR